MVSLEQVSTIDEAAECALACLRGEVYAGFQIQLNDPESPEANKFLEQDRLLLSGVSRAVRTMFPRFRLNACLDFNYRSRGHESPWHVDPDDDWSEAEALTRFKHIAAHKTRKGSGLVYFARASEEAVDTPQLTDLIKGRKLVGENPFVGEYGGLVDGPLMSGELIPGKYTFFDMGNKSTASTRRPFWHYFQTRKGFMSKRHGTTIFFDTRGFGLYGDIRSGKAEDMVDKLVEEFIEDVQSRLSRND